MKDKEVVAMLSHIDSFTQSLRNILARELTTESSFASFAICGEQLRRALVMADEPAPEAGAAVARYEQKLQAYSGPFPKDLAQDLDTVFGSLKEYSNCTFEERDLDAGEDLVREVEEVLCIARALAVCGRLTSDELDKLSSSAALAMRNIAGSLPEMWDYAENRELLFGPDPDFPCLFDFWETLACNAPGRLALENSVGYATQQQREAVLERLLEKVAPEHEVISMLDWVRQRVNDIWTDVRIAVCTIQEAVMRQELISVSADADMHLEPDEIPTFEITENNRIYQDELVEIGQSSEHKGIPLLLAVIARVVECHIESVQVVDPEGQSCLLATPRSSPLAWYCPVRFRPDDEGKHRGICGIFRVDIKDTEVPVIGVIEVPVKKS